MLKYTRYKFLIECDLPGLVRIRSGPESTQCVLLCIHLELRVYPVGVLSEAYVTVMWLIEYQVCKDWKTVDDLRDNY